MSSSRMWRRASRRWAAMPAAPRVPHGCDVVDIDAEAKGWGFHEPVLAEIRIFRTKLDSSLHSCEKPTIAPASRSLRPGAERTVWLGHAGFLRTRRPVSPPSTIARALQARRAWRRSDARNGRDTRQ